MSPSFRSVLGMTITLTAICGFLPAQNQQTLPNGMLTTPGAASNFPFNTSGASHTWQWVYDSSQFVSPTPIYIVALAVRASPGGSVQAFSFPSVEVSMASSPNNYGVGTPPAGQDTVFANNLGPDLTVVRPAAPWAGGPVPPSGGPVSNWIDLGISGSFAYDPAAGLDLVIQIRSCGATTLWGASIDGRSGTIGANGGNRYGNTTAGGCTALSRNFNNDEYVPVVLITYSATSPNPVFETNSPASAVDLNGVQGTAWSKARTPVCPAGTATLNLISNQTGLPFEAAFNFADTVAAGAGAVPVSATQLWNLDPGAATAYWNGASAPLFLPFSGNVALPLISQGGPATAAIQQANFSPAHPDGFELSQAAQLDMLAPGAGPGFPLPGPTGDDTFVTINAIQPNIPPGCVSGGAPVTFYGVVYTQMHVISNGRVQFGTGVPSTSFSPTVAQALAAGSLGFAGNWCDLNPAAGGNITIDLIGGVIYRVNYNAVAYFGQPGTANTFNLQFDLVTNAVQLDGLSGITNGGTVTAFLGISRGGGATDPGAALFSPTGTGSTFNATDMLYNLGVSGTNAPGINTILFVPNGLGNYDFASS